MHIANFLVISKKAIETIYLEFGLEPCAKKTQPKPSLELELTRPGLELSQNPAWV